MMRLLDKKQLPSCNEYNFADFYIGRYSPKDFLDIFSVYLLRNRLWLNMSSNKIDISISDFIDFQKRLI